MRRRQKVLIPIGVGSAICYVGLLAFAIAGRTDADGLTLFATVGIVYVGFEVAGYLTLGRMASRLERWERRTPSDRPAHNEAEALAATALRFRRARQRFALALPVAWLPLALAAFFLPRFVRPSLILLAILLYGGLLGGVSVALRWERRLQRR